MKLLTIIIILLNTVQMYPIQATPQTEPKATTKRGELILNCGKKQSLFFNAHWKECERMQKEHSIPMAISYSILILESAWGKSRRATQDFNFTGIKYNGKYAVFRSKEDFYKAFAKVLNQDCYQNIDRTAIDAWLYALQWNKCGYATSKQYKAKLSQLIKQYKLDEL
jgi:flagellum-specific peptidoglycan hydrolase FlgJ